MNEQTVTGRGALPGRWLLFSQSDNREDIERYFKARFSVDTTDPAKFTVIPTGGGQLAGPIPERAEQVALEV